VRIITQFANSFLEYIAAAEDNGVRSGRLSRKLRPPLYAVTRAKGIPTLKSMKSLPLFVLFASLVAAGCRHSLMPSGGGSGTTAGDCGCKVPPEQLKAIKSKSDLTNYASTDSNSAKVKYGVPTQGDSADVAPATKTATPVPPKGGPGAVTEAALGLPFYPGSKASSDAGPSLISDDSEARRVISFRVSADEPKRVLEFYKGKILMKRDGDSYSNGKCCGGTQSTMTGVLKNGAEAKMTANRTDGKKVTIIMVTVKTLKHPA